MKNVHIILNVSIIFVEWGSQNNNVDLIIL